MRSAAGFAQSLVRFSLVLVGFSFEFSCDAICRTMTRCFFASQSNYVFTACHFGREISLTRTRTFLGHTRTVATLHSSLYTLSACCVVVVNYFSSRSAHFPAFSWSVDNCVDQHQLQHNNANQILVFSFFLLFFTAVFLILFVFSFNWFLRYLWASLWGDNCTLTPTAATTTTLSGKQQQQQHWRAITTSAAATDANSAL